VEGSQGKGYWSYWSGKIRTPGLSCLSIDSADYEAGNIVARFYAADSVPDEQVLKDDLRAMLALYDVLAHSVGWLDTLTQWLGLRYNELRLMKDSVPTFLPLYPATLHILLSLASEDLHGYGIMQEVARQSQGTYKLGPGTLYDNLQKLIQRKVVQELGRRPGDEDPRRRYYRLTSLGRDVLAAETDRLADVVRQARLRLQIAKPRRA
jgi:DNA-binding PadR family transcriptional regulator